ncbi:hypothetical protein [Hafnia alvei]|uniref:Uncharacterized protein n=1 Tax=Hafnia alvei TaxID=569 RepID=A0A1C6YX25_HAFAL|nr:hypothetical protein [Hafnia alvei]SCM51410.1 hypothetical protein BN1044_00872 [Hafnia alvei]
MTSREQFEAWVMSIICISKQTLIGLREGDNYRNSTLSGRDYQSMWMAWQASREAVEVELPDKKFISEDEALIPEDSDWPDGFNTALEQCAEAIRAAGIKVIEGEKKNG